MNVFSSWRTAVGMFMTHLHTATTLMAVIQHAHGCIQSRKMIISSKTAEFRKSHEPWQGKKNKFSTVFYKRRRKRHLSPQKRNTLISLETKEKQPPDLESFSKDHSFTHSLTLRWVNLTANQYIQCSALLSGNSLSLSASLVHTRTRSHRQDGTGWHKSARWG